MKERNDIIDDLHVMECMFKIDKDKSPENCEECIKIKAQNKLRKEPTNYDEF